MKNTLFKGFGRRMAEMRNFMLLLFFIMAFAGQASAFNPDPIRYEYIGVKDSDKSSIFYEIASAKADGPKGVLVVLQADPKNRTLRYYRNVVIDPVTMSISAMYCELYDYNGNILETFNLPNESVQYSKGDLTDKIYQDLVAKRIVQVEATAPRVEVARPLPPANYQNEVANNSWKEGLAGGAEYDSNVLAEVDNSEPLVLADL